MKSPSKAIFSTEGLEIGLLFQKMKKSYHQRRERGAWRKGKIHFVSGPDPIMKKKKFRGRHGKKI